MNSAHASVDPLGAPEEANRIFASVFGEEADIERLASSRIFLMRGVDRQPLAAAAMEPMGVRTWYVWLFAVKEEYRGQGVGRRLLDEVTSSVKSEDGGSLHLKTYQRFDSMRRLLQRSGWFLLGAEMSERHDGVGEIWQIPLTDKPLGIAVIGANPAGRGGEWAKRILELPRLWELRGVVDPNDRVRQTWSQQGVRAFADVRTMVLETRPRAILVAVPPMQATAVQAECISLGLPMLVEKPFAGSLAELAGLQRMLTANPVPFVLAVQRRSHPSYVALRCAIRKQRVRDLSIRLLLGRPADDRPAGHRGDRSLCRGGALLDLGYHALDLVHFLLDSPLEMVSCSLSAGNDLAVGIESAAQLLGRCGPSWVRLQIDRHGPAKTEEVMVRTDEGVWKADRECVWAPDGSVFYECKGSWESAELGKLAELAVVSHHPASSPGDLWDQLAAFELIERAYASSHIQGLEGACG
ncbi:MAG: GNAT family N-acetyltransferase [Verrucomicrobiales bacterium]